MLMVPTPARPITSLRAPSIDRDDDALEASFVAYDQGDHERAIASLLRYLDPNAFAGDVFSAGSRATLAHGSIAIDVESEGDRLRLRCPFVRLAERGRIAALRKCAEMNMDPLTLGQIRLEGDTLSFGFADAIAYAHPAKVLDVLREIASSADHHDDVFVEKFQAVRLRPSGGTSPDPAAVGAAVEMTRSLMRLGLEYVTLGLARNDPSFALDMALHAVWSLIDAARPQGYLGSAISDALCAVFELRELPARVARARKFFDEVQAMDDAKLAACFYPAPATIPLRRSLDHQQVQQHLERYHEYAMDCRARKSLLGGFGPAVGSHRAACALGCRPRHGNVRARAPERSRGQRLEGCGRRAHRRRPIHPRARRRRVPRG